MPSLSWRGGDCSIKSWCEMATVMVIHRQQQPPHGCLWILSVKVLGRPFCLSHSLAIPGICPTFSLKLSHPWNQRASQAPLNTFEESARPLCRACLSPQPWTLLRISSSDQIASLLTHLGSSLVKNLQVAAPGPLWCHYDLMTSCHAVFLVQSLI